MAKEKPLSGVRIIAVEQYGAGPYGSMYLADLGAEVIKIENPQQGGDIARKSGPFFIEEGESTFFHTFNLNKKSITLNLKQEKARHVFNDLVKSSDAVLNNLRGDQAEKLGLDYKSLKAVKPSICCAHLSAYGRDNDRKAWPGYDYLMQAEAGLMALTGEPDGPPVRFGLSMVDFMSGVTLALGLTAALFSACKSGVGRDVDVSLFDVALHQLTYPGTWYLNHQHETQRLVRSSHPSAIPCQLYRTKDAWIFIMAMTEKFWQRFVELVDSTELHSEKFASLAARQANREALNNAIERALQQRSTHYWMDCFGGELPAAPVNQLGAALDNPFIRELGMIKSATLGHGETIKVLSNPIKLDSERSQTHPCSTLGADTSTILQELGYSLGDIEQLRKEHCL